MNVAIQFSKARVRAALLLLFISVSSIYAQGTLKNYRAAEEVGKLYQNKVFDNPNYFEWIDSIQFWYVTENTNGKTYMRADIASGKKESLFDHQRVATSLSTLLKKKVDAAKLPIHSIKIDVKTNGVRFAVDSCECYCDLAKYECVVEKISGPAAKPSYWGNFFDEASSEPVVSPDEKWKAFIRDNNLFIEDQKTKERFQLSYDGAPGSSYSSHLYWSHDSKKIATYKVTPGDRRQIAFIESSPVDQLQPKLHYRDYRKPGDALPQRYPQLFLVDEKRHVPVDSRLFSNQYYLEEIKWRNDNRAFTFEFNARGHQEYKIIEVDGETGAARELVAEKSRTFIDYSSKRYRYDVGDGAEIIWASERDGWNHLYLYDGSTGNVKNQITKGAWVVRRVEYVDEPGRKIIFAASGLNADQDPYLIHYCVINFDGTGFRRLTTSNANHTAFFSPDHRHFVNYESRADVSPSSTVVRVDDGSEVMAVSKADITELQKTGWKFPEVFRAKGRDNQTDIWGLIYRPRNVNATRKYPVIEYIYAGPHGFNVPKNFHIGYSMIHALTELGFVVVIIDGMGTSGRSKAFHDVCWKNLKDAGFEDRIRWIKAASAKYRYIDASRVGIFGGSAGGQNAMGAVLFHPYFYKAAVASCGSHDNRMDKIWWNEQWMGYPLGPHYSESSNVTNAHKLGGKLMLIVGELDDNVDPATTLQVADALIKANKDFELVVLPGHSHTGGGIYGERKRRDFFVRHLLGVEPPEWSEIYGQ